ESNQDKKDEKFNRVDVLAKDSQGALILIEVQYERELDYFHRIAYGGAKLLSNYLKKGEPYGQLKKVVTVHIVYFDLGSGKDYLYKGTTSFQGIYQNDELKLNPAQENLFKTDVVSDIFPQHYLIRIDAYQDEVKNTLDEWVYFLKNSVIKETFKAKNIKKAQRKLDVLKMNPKERQAYDHYLENLSYQKSVFQTARYEGLMEGLKEGIAEGKKEGKIEGEKKGKIETAKNMLKDGFSASQIQKYTGLSIEEIEKLAY
ncbi:MAG TPA: hypothetical protein DHW82_13920, partial [Spirochaetia bacterium]|nr:hypothetical protein [Spirochaetia bacterium]